MKKRALAAFAVFIPLVATLCACGGTATVAINANWYKSGEGDNIGGKSEKLEYEVTFEKAGENMPLSYDKGTYVTELTAESIKLSDDTSVTGYHLSSKLDISGTYTVNGYSENFTDKVESHVYFKAISSRLQPVSSTKYVKCSAPLANPKTLQEAYKLYEYTYATVYNESFNKAEITYTQTQPQTDTPEVKETVSFKNNSVFFDNEQLLFVLRGLSMDSAVSLKTINPLDFSVTKVEISEKPKLTTLTDYTFEMDGAAVTDSISAYEVSLTYKSSFPGREQKLLYAANTATADTKQNTYRNMLLEMSVPVLQGYGTLNYKLVKATFTGE